MLDNAEKLEGLRPLAVILCGVGFVTARSLKPRMVAISNEMLVMRLASDATSSSRCAEDARRLLVS